MPIFNHEKSKLKASAPLKNPPLLEVVFELRWEIEVDQKQGRMRDPAYPMLYGRLCEKFQRCG